MVVFRDGHVTKCVDFCARAVFLCNGHPRWCNVRYSPLCFVSHVGATQNLGRRVFCLVFDRCASPTCRRTG